MTQHAPPPSGGTAIGSPERMLTLRLYEDAFPVGAPPVYLPGGTRALFVHAGGASFAFEEYTQAMEAGGGVTGTGQVMVSAGAEGAVIWRWELCSTNLAVEDTALRAAPSVSSTLKLESDLDLDPRFEWLIRLDRVSFPPGGTAWTHQHQGPGIRICRDGLITIEIEGVARQYGPGEPWAENGVAPVLAPTTPEASTTFIRCFLLPVQLRGASSIRFVLPEDREKTNTQSYHVFGERPIARPRS